MNDDKSKKIILVDKTYLLQKFNGKGGWTYVEIPEVAPDKHAWFNWIKVHGLIDDIELKHARLMPLGNGNMMLPVKAAIRKSIRKEAGDWVHIKLYPNNLPAVIPIELLECIEMENSTLVEVFKRQSSNKQQEIIDWIYSAKKEETKARRIVRLIEFLEEKMKQ